MEKPEDVHAESTKGSVDSWPLVASAAIVAGTSLGAFAPLGTPPGANYGGEETISWFRMHREAVRWSVWFFTVGAPPLAVTFALLRRLLPRTATSSSLESSPTSSRSRLSPGSGAASHFTLTDLS